jgi:hypothetical protein
LIESSNDVAADDCVALVQIGGRSAKSADVPLWLYDTNGVPKLLRSGTRSFAARPPFRELLCAKQSLDQTEAHVDPA